MLVHVVLQTFSSTGSICGSFWRRPGLSRSLDRGNGNSFICLIGPRASQPRHVLFSSMMKANQGPIFLIEHRAPGTAGLSRSAIMQETSIGIQPQAVLKGNGESGVTSISDHVDAWFRLNVERTRRRN